MNSSTSCRVASGSWFCLLALAMSAMPAWTAASERLDAWEDRDRFPEAYSILTSDRVMFPDDISDWPLKIDSRHQLFVDDFLISKIEHLSRHFHQPVKEPKNPLIPGGYVGVLYDADTSRFRMWNGQARQSPRLFTSADGVHWEGPDLNPSGDLILEDGGELRGFMYNPDLPMQEGRYKMVLERRIPVDTKEPGFYLYHSRDGVNWEQRPQRPILERSRVNCMLPCKFRPTGAGEPHQFQWENPDHIQSCGVGDTSTFRYDTVLNCYIFDGKFNLYLPPEKIAKLGIATDQKPQLRLRTFSESEDLIHWSPPRFMMYPDRLDPPDRQIYAHVGFVYQSMWIGLIQTMRYQVTGWKQVDLCLSYSRDGRHWLRPQQREPFIPLGDADSWDSDYLVASYTAPVQMGEELLFYYAGSRHPKRHGKEPDGPWPLYIGLARLRCDGFASLDAGNTPGHLVTRPLMFEGKTLYVNADAGENGWVKAAVLSRDSEPIPGYTLDDAVPLTEDSTKARMVWKAKKTLAPPDDDHVRIQFQLKNARLYSFWIE